MKLGEATEVLLNEKIGGRNILHSTILFQKRHTVVLLHKELVGIESLCILKEYLSLGKLQWFSGNENFFITNFSILHYALPLNEFKNGGCE